MDFSDASGRRRVANPSLGVSLRQASERRRTERSPRTVDAIVQVGTNMSMVSVAAEAEARLGKPVIAINTATYWHALRACGIEDRITGLGRLLADF